MRKSTAADLARGRKWRQENKEEYLQYLRDWRKRNPKKQAEYKARHSTPEKARNRFLKHRYGISQDQFDALLKKQDGKCEICQGPPVGRGNRFHVDHDHQTKKVRGLLCSRCNILIGQAKESVWILESAISYLKEKVHV